MCFSLKRRGKRELILNEELYEISSVPTLIMRSKRSKPQKKTTRRLWWKWRHCETEMV
jgi:hypothetical protein